MLETEKLLLICNHSLFLSERKFKTFNFLIYLYKTKKLKK